MKTHLIFCCSEHCKWNLMRELYQRNKKHFLFTPKNKTMIGNEEYIFIVDINNNLSKLNGLVISSYESCGKYSINQKVVEICESLKEQE